MDVLIDCSLSNSAGAVCVDVEGELVAISPSGEYTVVGTYHPDGEAAADAWVSKHVDLLNDLVCRIEKTDSNPQHEAAISSVIDQGGPSTAIETEDEAAGRVDALDSGEDADGDDDTASS